MRESARKLSERKLFKQAVTMLVASRALAKARGFATNSRRIAHISPAATELKFRNLPLEPPLMAVSTSGFGDEHP